MSIYFSQFKFLRDRRERIISPALIRYFFLFQYSMDRKVFLSIQSFESLSHVWLFVTPWTPACQASLPVTNSRSLLKLMSIELVIPSNHLILCHPLLLPPSIFPRISLFQWVTSLYQVAKLLEPIDCIRILTLPFTSWVPVQLFNLPEFSHHGNPSNVFSHLNP